MSFYKIRPRSGSKLQWETANTVLAEREIGYELPDGGLGTGLVKMKMGDGVTPWNDLPYAISSQGEVVDNLESDSAELPLSARQGKILNANFSLATNTIGNILVAKGISVPIGTSLLDMASIIEDNLYYIAPTTVMKSTAVDTTEAGATWTVPFSTLSLTSGSTEVLSLANGVFTTLVDIATLHFVWAGAGVEQAAAHPYNHYVYVNDVGTKLGSSEEASYVWSKTLTDIPAGTTIYFKNQSDGGYWGGATCTQKNLSVIFTATL